MMHIWTAYDIMFPDTKGAFCGYRIRNPAVEWSGTDTYIQRTGIDYDYGIFDSPDEFYAKHGSNLSGPRRVLYTWFVRHLMNATVVRIRATRC
jgi:hypothetical protein